MQASRHELLGRLGGSPSTLVALVRDPSSSPPFVARAVKLFDTQLLDDRRFSEHFFLEARRAAMVEHPNLVSIIGFGTTGPVHHLLMEYVFGASLAQLLRASAWAKTPLSIGAVLHIGRSIAHALAAAWEREDEEGKPLELIHGFVTPHNVLVGFDGRPKLADLGVARITNRASVRASTGAEGIYAYMSPEQARGDGIDARSDVFSLGIVLWEALTGHPLFRGKSRQEVIEAVTRAPIRRPSRFVPSITPAVDAIILRALERVPSRRFSHAMELGAALDALLDRGPPIDDRRVAAEMKQLFELPIVGRNFATQSVASNVISPCDMRRAIEVHRFQGTDYLVIPDRLVVHGMSLAELFPREADFSAERARPWSARPAPREISSVELTVPQNTEKQRRTLPPEPPAPQGWARLWAYLKKKLG
ncbi:MAG: serine/threonine-protein kinase [Myxococcota bacterium]